MYSVYIEMPLGNQSQPHEFAELADATKLFDSFVRQMRSWKQFHATMILKGEGKLVTEEIQNA